MDLKKFLMLKQDICRLVLGFLKKNAYEQTADEFMKECPELYEIFVAKQAGEEIECSEKLEKIITEHQFIKRSLNKLNPRDDMSLRDKFLTVINKKDELVKESSKRRDYFSAERKYNYEYKDGQKVISSQTIVNRLPSGEEKQHNNDANENSLPENTNLTDEYMEVNQDVERVLVLENGNLSTGGALVEQIPQTNDQVVGLQLQGTSCGNVFPDEYLYVNDLTSSNSFMIQKQSINLVGNYNINNLEIVQTNDVYETISPSNIVNTNTSSTPHKTTSRKTTPSHVRALTFSPKGNRKQKIIKTPLKITEIQELPNVVITGVTGGNAGATVNTSSINTTGTDTATNAAVTNSSTNIDDIDENNSDCVIQDESTAEFPLNRNICSEIKNNNESEDMKKWKMIRSQNIDDLDTRLREINVVTGNNKPTHKEIRRKPRRKRVTNKKDITTALKKEEETDDDCKIIQAEIKKPKFGLRSQRRITKPKKDSTNENNHQASVLQTENITKIAENNNNGKKVDINDSVVPTLYKTEIEKRTNNIGFLLETPLKDCIPGYVPITPGLPSLMCKPEDIGFNASSLFGSLTKSELGSPALNSAITPGQKCLGSQNFKNQTPKCGVMTEYSSGGSYYKPDEAEDIEIDRIKLRSSTSKQPKETEMKNEKAELSKILEDGELNSTGSSNNDVIKEGDSNLQHELSTKETEVKQISVDENSNSSISSTSSSTSSSSNSTTSRSSSSSSENTTKNQNENIVVAAEVTSNKNSKIENIKEEPTKSMEVPTAVVKSPSNKMQLRKSRVTENNLSVTKNVNNVQNELQLKKERMKKKIELSNKKKAPPKVISRYNAKQAASKLRAMRKPTTKLTESPICENNSEILTALQLSAKKLSSTDTTEKKSTSKLHFAIKQNKTKKTDAKLKEIETNVNKTDLVASKHTTRQKELEKKKIDELNSENEEAISSDDDYFDCKIVHSQQMQSNYIEIFSRSDNVPKEKPRDKSLGKKIFKIGFDQSDNIILKPTEIMQFLDWSPQVNTSSKLIKSVPKKRKILENSNQDDSFESSDSKIQTNAQTDTQNAATVPRAKLSKCEIETVLSRLHGKNAL